MLAKQRLFIYKNDNTIEVKGHRFDVIAFRKDLTVWGRDNFRRFPWRLTKNPYYILMAEVMLHRTQASQVVPVYLQFIERYPGLPELANATVADLQKRLFSLGLRWRIDMIYKMSKDIQERFMGRIPREKADLVLLPGVSDYIASAVRCFAWNKPEAIIDTNSVRIVGRLFRLEIKDSSRRSRLFRIILEALIDPLEPRTFNYALLDLAAQICIKKEPKCHLCPVNNYCAYEPKRLFVRN